MIADAEGPSALAGVMGGQVSEIRETTRRVLLGKRVLRLPRGVRRTARRYGLHTEASHRFERGVDYGQVAHVLERAKTLLTELASGSAVPGAIHARGAQPALPEITLRSARLDALLGAPVPFTEACAIIERLGFPMLEVSGSGASAVLRTRAVSFRPDVTREVDLIERGVPRARAGRDPDALARGHPAAAASHRQARARRGSGSGGARLVRGRHLCVRFRKRFWPRCMRRSPASGSLTPSVRNAT